MLSSPDKDIAEFTANRFRLRYVIALALIATLTLISQWVIQLSMADEEHDSRVVNIAGRQRMLSQKITKTCYYLLGAGTTEARRAAREQLQEALALWRRSHSGLQHGDQELGLPGTNSPQVTELFRAIEPDYQAMVMAASSVLAAPDGTDEIQQAVRRLGEHEGAFLRGMDAIVFRYDSEAKEKVDFARHLELGLGALTLLVLILEARLIFAPAVRRLRHDMHRHEHHKEDLERLFAASPTAMFLMDETSLVIIRGNSKAEALMGCSADGFLGRPISDFLDTQHEANRAFLEKVHTGDILNEYEVLLIDARRSIVEALASSCRISYSNRRSYVIGITDITEIKKAQQTLRYYATFDEMTALVNRRTGLLMLSAEMERAIRDQRPLTVCFIDIDHLKVTNDQHGHHEGDWMIRTLAAELLESIRAGDVAARLGGDEFLLILHDCAENDANLLVERIGKRLDQIAVDEARPYRLSASFGVTVYDPARHATPEELIAAADSRMYEAKHARRTLMPESTRIGRL
jgi:diguanylate cyclase (GGDEF)-like protein/PAS domain S-box-containing protein